MGRVLRTLNRNFCNFGFVGMMKMAKLIDITGKALSGEWGVDDERGDGIPVLRTTNFTNEGTVNYNNVVTRVITKKNIDEKFLRKGDIIIEKSGGSDKFPVGRVIYFDGDENTYLFNNFTGLLRVKNQEIWYPRYIFYSLFANYKRGGTRRFENKTTGLHNLKTDDYVSRYEVVEIDKNEQISICAKLDTLYNVIKLQQQELALLNDLIKARFVEMFGDVIHNDRKWECKQFSDITTSRLGKMLDTKHQTGTCQYPYLANFNVQWFRFELGNLNEMDFNEKEREEFCLENGDLLVCEGGEIGRCAVWHNQIKKCFFQKALHRVRCNQDIILPDYLSWWFKYNCENGGFAAIEGAKATISHLTGTKMKMLNVTVPPIELQEQFVDIIHQIDKSKVIAYTIYMNYSNRRSCHGNKF